MPKRKSTTPSTNPPAEFMLYYTGAVTNVLKNKTNRSSKDKILTEVRRELTIWFAELKSLERYVNEGTKVDRAAQWCITTGVEIVAESMQKFGIPATFSSFESVHDQLVAEELVKMLESTPTTSDADKCKGDVPATVPAETNESEYRAGYKAGRGKKRKDSTHESYILGYAHGRAKQDPLFK